MNASDFMRKTDAEKEYGYEKVSVLVKNIAAKLWDKKGFVIQTDYEKSLMNGKLFGTRFAVDISGVEAEEVYDLMNDNLLSRDTMSENFQKDLEAGKVFDLGDAVVVPHGAIVNPSKTDFKFETKPVLGITFNLVLPEDIPDDYDLKEEDEETEDES